MSGARSLRCEGCGGQIPLLTISAAVRCPYCGRQNALTSQTFAELRQYGAEVERRLAAANQELRKADAFNRWQREGRTPGKNLAMGMGLMVGVPTLLALGGYLLFATGVLEDAGPVFSFSLMGASYLGVFGYVVWYAMGRSKRTEAVAGPGASRVACPNCGAPNVMRAGQVLESCGHCGASLSPTRTVMMRGLSAAQQAHRSATMARYRAERSSMHQALQYNMANYIPYIAMGSLVPMILPTTAIFTWQMLVSGEEPFSPAIFIMWAFSAGLVGAIAGLVIYRRSKRAAWREGLGDLARQFHGTVSHDLGSLVGWLNSYWAAPYRTTWLYNGPYFGVALLDACGYATLLDVEPDGYSGQHGGGYPRRIHIALAAWIEGISEGGRAAEPDARAQELLQWIAHSGFEVDATAAGLIARARPEVIKKVRRDPSSAHELAPIIASLAEVAERMGARPVPPIR